MAKVCTASSAPATLCVETCADPPSAATHVTLSTLFVGESKGFEDVFGLSTTEQLLRSQLFGCILPFIGKSLSSKEVIKILKADGWTLARVNGSHHQFTHPTKSGVVTVPHPKKGLKKGTQHAIFKLAGIKPP